MNDAHSNSKPRTSVIIIALWAVAFAVLDTMEMTTARNSSQSTWSNFGIIGVSAASSETGEEDPNHSKETLRKFEEHAPLLGSRRLDQETLVDIFHALEGPKMWPFAWKDHWRTQRNASDLYICGDLSKFPEWHGAQCENHVHRLHKLYHRSGLAGGSIPSTISNLKYLEVLDLSTNRIGGSIPDTLGKLENATTIALSDNRLEGTIPTTFNGEGAGLRKLRYLHLSNNKLSGTIPAFLGELTQLETLFLDGNDFEGKIPFDALSKLKNLRHLRLDGNPKLEGTVPQDFLANSPQLVAVELAGLPNVKLPLDPVPSALANNVHYVTYGATVPTDIPGAFNSTRTVPKTVAGADGGLSATLRFMSIGDHGTGGQWLGSWHEVASAKQFNRIAQWLDTAFTTSVGDNLYVWPGIKESDLFHHSFELMFDAPALLNRPWFATFGNHDHPNPQMEYSRKSNRWKFPGAEYQVKGIKIPHRDGSIDEDSATLDVFFHDTVSKYGRYGGVHYSQLAAALNASTARYKILVTHYPALSGGCHKIEKSARHYMPLLRKYNVTAVFAGHDHHSELIMDSGGTIHSLTGAFSRGPCHARTPPGHLWSDNIMAGFSYVTIDPYLMNITYVSELGAMMYVARIPFDWNLRGKHNESRLEGGLIPTKEEVRRYVAMNKAQSPSLLLGGAPQQITDPPRPGAPTPAPTKSAPVVTTNAPLTAAPTTVVSPPTPQQQQSGTTSAPPALPSTSAQTTLVASDSTPPPIPPVTTTAKPTSQKPTSSRQSIDFEDDGGANTRTSTGGFGFFSLLPSTFVGKTSMLMAIFVPIMIGGVYVFDRRMGFV